MLETLNQRSHRETEVAATVDAQDPHRPAFGRASACDRHVVAGPQTRESHVDLEVLDRMAPLRAAEDPAQNSEEE